MKNFFKILVFPIFTVIFLVSCNDNLDTIYASSDVENNTSIYGFTDTIGVNLNSYNQVDSLFKFLNFNLDTVRYNGIVSPIMVNNMTKSISELDVKTRKAVFIKMMLVHSLVANKTIQLERDSLID